MYRSPNKAKDDEDKTMLGETQKQVFIDWLATVSRFLADFDVAEED